MDKPPVITWESFTIGNMYFLSDCRPIKDQFDAYQKTFSQKGYNLLIDPVTYMALAVSNGRGLEPLSFYRFGATAFEDNALVHQILQLEDGLRKKAIEDDADQFCKSTLGTVTVELDTVSTRLFDHIGKLDKPDKAHLLPYIHFPDTMTDEAKRILLPDGKFILGVKAMYFPGLVGYLSGCNLDLSRIQGSHAYTEDELKSRSPRSHTLRILENKEGMPEDFPDTALRIWGKDPDDASDAIDKTIKAVHGISNVRYLPVLVQDAENPSTGDYHRFWYMASALYDTGFGGDDRVFVEAEEARKSGKVYTLKDTGLVA